MQTVEDFIRQEITQKFYEALKVKWKGGTVEINFEPDRPILMAVMTSPSFIKDVEPCVMDVREIVRNTLPGLWGYIDADLGSREEEQCLRCGQIFEMNPRRQRDIPEVTDKCGI